MHTSFEYVCAAYVFKQRMNTPSAHEGDGLVAESPLGHQLRWDSTIRVVCHHASLVVEHFVSTPAEASLERPGGRA